MSHITCHICGDNEHVSGYGFACGPLGHYTICDCGALLEFMPDLDGVDVEHTTRIQESVDAWRASVNLVRREKGLPLI